MLYVLCFPRLDPGATARIEAFRRRHEPARAALVAAHVTLVFGLRALAPAELIARAAELAAGCRPFELELAAAEPFADPVEDRLKLFLKVGRGAGSLVALHRRLYAGPQHRELRADLPFRAHMTVATAEGAAALAAARAEIPDLGLPLAGRVEALSVVALEAGRLRSLAELPLGAART